MIKNILVSLPTDPSSVGTVNYAVSIAVAFDAHLTGLAFVYDPFVPGTVFDGGATAFIATYRDQDEKAAKAAVAKFENAARDAGVSTSLQRLESGLQRLDDLFARFARRFDLTVVGQSYPAPTRPKRCCRRPRCLGPVGQY